MTPAARILSVIEILDLFDAQAVPLDRVCDAYFRARRFIGSSDRRFIGDMVFAVMRSRMKLDWHLEKSGLALSNRLRVLAFLKIFENKIPYEIGGVLGGKYGAEPLDDTERSALESMAQDAAMPEYVAGECAEWLLPKIQAAFPQSWREELLALQNPASFDLRVNTLKKPRDAALAEIPPELHAKPTPLSPHGIRLESRAGFGALAGLKDGVLEVQDEGSQMVGLLCDAQPGMQILDYCAGAGGKALALAAEMQNKGRIVLCDTHDKRLKNAAERFKRAGAHNYELRLLDNDGKKWLKRQEGRFDRVLCDVPCSGTGTWRRNPDLRYRFDQKDLTELCALQRNILAEAAGYVKKDGLLIYATCSMLREENEEQMEWFIKEHPGFLLCHPEGQSPEGSFSPGMQRSFASLRMTKGGYLRLTPAKDATDGFFAAVLKKG